MSGRFYNDSIKITDDHSVSVPVVIGGLAVLVYLFGFGFLSGFSTTLLLQVIGFSIVASIAWSVSTQGIIRTMLNFLAFGIALYILIQMFEAAPTWIRGIDVSGYEGIITELDQNYSGHVEIGGENGVTFNKDGNTPDFYAPPATEIEQTGGGVPQTITQPVASNNGQTVSNEPQPTVDVLSQQQAEIYGYIERDMIDQAYNSAVDTYSQFSDDYSFNIVADIQHQRDIKTNRQDNLPVATSSSTSFMAGGEQDRTERLLAGNTWSIVSAGEGYGIFSCQKNLIIEQEDGLLKGSQFTVKECTLKGLSNKGKIGSTFNGGV